jgi:hypothetical protein
VKTIGYTVTVAFVKLRWQCKVDLLLPLTLIVFILAVMAKQAGDIKITGTVDDVSFYKMQGAYYVRRKSSLTGKKFWKDKAFEGSRESCSRFARGNVLASEVYRNLDKEKRSYSLFLCLKKKAIELLKNKIDEERMISLLQQYVKELAGENTTQKRKIKPLSKTRSYSNHCPSVLMLPLNFRHSKKRSNSLFIRNVNRQPIMQTGYS